MKALTKLQLVKVTEFVNCNGRDIDKALLKFSLDKDHPKSLLDSLKTYQNSDGGFGHGLEPDFRTDYSSAIATTYAFQYFHKLKQPILTDFMENALEYLVQTYNKPLQMWFPIPERSDSSPHAIWWNYDPSKYAQDDQWGNPAVEIIGYLLKYPNSFDKGELQELKNRAVERLLSAQSIEVHELMCYQRFSHSLDDSTKAKVDKKLIELTVSQVERDSTKWSGYVSRPLFFVDGINSPVLPYLKAEVDAELDYLIDTLTDEGAWHPNWHWGQYDDVWESVKPEVSAMITVKNLMTLIEFGRIEK